MLKKKQIIDPHLFAEKLKKARKLRKMTGKALAEKAKLSPQTISRYENAESVPSFSNLCMISEVTSFPIDFFIQGNMIDTKNEVIYFRKINKASSLSIKMGEEIIDIIEKYYDFFSQYIIFPELKLIREPLDLEKEYSHDEIEDIANAQRNLWDLEDGPINNLTWNVEKNGILVSRVHLEDDYLDGQSTWINNKRPLILLSADKDCAVRSRFDIIHELAHLVLHGNYEDEFLYDSKIMKKMEKEASNFASAFLMPEKEFLSSVFSTSINDFILLKQKWKVSIAAMVQRCYDLNIISDVRFTSLQKQISYNRWRKEEPLDKDMPIEQPKLFSTVVENLLVREVLSKRDILNVLKLPREMVEKFLTLKPDVLKEEELYNNVIEIKDFQQE